MARILIVDDERLPTDVLLLIARRCGHQGEVAGSGEEALAALKATTPDLVILDIALPGMDGFAVLAWMRSQPHLAKTDVVMYTAAGGSESIERAKAAGAAGYWIKSSVSVAEITRRFQELPQTA